MYKGTARAFSFGILFSVSVIGVSYFSIEEKTAQNSFSDAKKIVEEQGYVILTKKQYEEFKTNSIQKGDSSETGGESAPATEKKEEVETKPIVEQKQQSKKIENTPITIESGMSTEEISDILKEAGVVDDAEEFNQFLINNELNTRVQVGTFELNNEMSYDKIAQIITKS